MTRRASVLWMLAVLLLTAPFAIAANTANEAPAATPSTLATPSVPDFLQATPEEIAALAPSTPAWLPAAGLPACYQSVCVNVCFKKGKGCTIAGQTCSCNP